MTNAALDLDLARRLVDAALTAASDREELVSAAVVDAGGHLVAFARMDGAEIAGPTLAIDKAYTSVAHRCATADLAPLVAPGGDLVGMHSNGGGRYVCFGGGVPLHLGDVLVGGLGVSGAAAAIDHAIATQARSAV